MKMRILFIFFIGTVLLTSSCAGANKRLRKSRKPATEVVTPKAEASKVTSPVSPIKEVEEKLVKHDEKLPDPHRYFVIIGSFRNPDNAKNYQSQIIKEGFVSDILKNEAGLYRVSVMATDDVTRARNEVRRIWSKFPKYSDTWLLIQRK